MSKSQNLIVSPSGNFYGSEQVLYNFLCHTTQNYIVYVPKGSKFYNKLEELKRHHIVGFGNVKLLYLKLFFKILNDSYTALYINEGGHVKYAKLMAQLFNKLTVVLHIRLLEDCKASRLGQIPSNMILVSISDYISSQLTAYDHHKIYDPLDTAAIEERDIKNARAKFCIGIIGRVSNSKGLVYYDEFFEHIVSSPFNVPIEFQFFGDIVHQDPITATFYKTYHQHKSLPVVFKGFESNQKKLYDSVDMVLHLNPNEPLGRIGLESWARGIPFVCFNEGGAGEINKLLGMEAYSITLANNWQDKLKSRIENIMTATNTEDLEKAKTGVAKYFGMNRYVNNLEKLFKS